MYAEDFPGTFPKVYSKLVVWNNCLQRRSRFSEAILKTSPDIAKDAHQYHQRISS